MSPLRRGLRACGPDWARTRPAPPVKAAIVARAYRRLIKPMGDCSVNCRRLAPRGATSRHASGARGPPAAPCASFFSTRTLQILNPRQIPSARIPSSRRFLHAIADADRVGLVELREFRVVQEKILRTLLAGISLVHAVD